MRGGAIPLLVWGTLLGVLLTLNWIWTGDAIQIGSFGFALSLVLGAAGLLVLGSRTALRRGPPERHDEAEAVPDASLGAVLAALSLACIAFGLAFGRFLIFFGGGVLIAALGRIALELRSQRATRAGTQRRSE